ncbi:MAG: excinuclease ABC subunit UvrC [Treponema sp.]|jgi:excinuclease ABC subunit C|nr:excinuclease ABC subunit UvrC [Treponema sp.]
MSTVNEGFSPSAALTKTAELPFSLDRLKAQARDAPLEPGVYIMRDGDGAVIYVGKARVLRNRLGSYFAGEKDIKTATLIRHVRSIETIIVASEYEALLLENTLIKQHFPKYNINLKDGKTYPVVRITHEEFPRIFRTRHIVEDGSRYYGPFPQIESVDTMLELVEKLFPLRKCRTLRKRENPCMYFHIGRCKAPCCGKIGAEEYGLQVSRVEKLLTGSAEGGACRALIEDLDKDMRLAAAALKFEEAAQLRNAIRAIENLSTGNSVVDFDPEGRDYIAWAGEGVLSTFTVFSMRGGKMTGRELYRTRSAAEGGESLETFMASYYDPGRPPPALIYVQPETPGPEGSSGVSPGELASPGELVSPGELASPEHISPALTRWFREQFHYEVSVKVPVEKRHTAILALARQNALEDLRKRLKERGAGPALDELARVLSLRRRPERIEGFDIAQLDGKHPVASLISFKNGVPDKKNYRYFKLRTVVGIVDDFAAMREAVFRRYSRLVREGAELPDLVLIDGGIGQVNAAKGVLDELGMDSDIVGLAKRDEELWPPGARKPVRLSKDSEALKVLQFVRDETHRFATGLNQRLRSGDLLFPALESVEGIGPRRAARIMKAYQSIAGIAAAPPREIAERCGIGEASARAVRAAAQLALEDSADAKARLAAGRKRSSPRAARTAGLAAQALARGRGGEAAEPEDEYGGEGSPGTPGQGS